MKGRALILPAACLLLSIGAGIAPLEAGRTFNCSPNQFRAPQLLESLRIEAISEDGRRILLSSTSDPLGGNPDRRRQVFQYDVLSDGLSQITSFTQGQSLTVPIQSDGELSRLVFASNSDLTGENPDGSSEIFLLEVASRDLTQLTSGPASNGEGSTRPVLSADGNLVAFRSDDDLTGNNPDFGVEIFVVSLSDPQRLVRQVSLGFPHQIVGVPALDREGKQLAVVRFNTLEPVLQSRLILFQVDQASSRSLLRAGIISEPSISRDGRRITFFSSDDLVGGNPDGGTEVFSLTLDGDGSAGDPGRLEQITQTTVPTPVGAIGLPVLSGDGRRIFFPSSLDWTGENPTLNNQVFLYDFEERSLSQVTHGPRNVLTGRLPLSASGDRLAYTLQVGPPSGPTSFRIPVWTGCSPEQLPVLIFPQVVSGGGFGSELILTNPGRVADRGTVLFLENDGTPMELEIDSETRSGVPYTLAPGGTLKLEPVAVGQLRSGYAVVRSDLADSLLTGSLIYLWNGREVSVPAARPSKEYHVFTELTQQTASGAALVNPGPRPLNIRLTLLDASGEVYAEKDLALQGRHQVAEMLSELFPETLPAFNGSLHARADNVLALLGLRLRGSSLAALNSDPSAFPNSGSQILYLLDSGVDLNSLGFSDEELENSTVHELTGLDQSPREHLLELANTNETQGVTLAFRYFNENCEDVLQFLVLLSCGQSLIFDPFDFVPPGSDASTRERFFGSGPAGTALSGAQFAGGRFVLSITAVGHSVNADDQADILFPQEQSSLLACGPQPIGIGAGPGVRNSNLHQCNARYMAFDYLVGRQIFSRQSNCQGPIWVADEEILSASRQARELVEVSADSLAEQCLAPPSASSCPMIEALSQLGTQSCQGRPVGPSAMVKFPQPTFTLLR